MFERKRGRRKRGRGRMYIFLITFLGVGERFIIDNLASRGKSICGGIRQEDDRSLKNSQFTRGIIE